MSFALIIIGTSIHVLIWEKLPEWGSWFNALLVKLPRPLRKLYDDWHCAYCAGFWIALLLHAITGIWTIPALGEMSGFGVFLAWILDALATAIGIYTFNFLIMALKLPAMKAYQMEAEFKKEHFEKE